MAHGYTADLLLALHPFKHFSDLRILSYTAICTLYISQMNIVCVEPEGKRPYMECGSLQCLERDKSWFVEGGDQGVLVRLHVTNRKRGIQLNVHFVLI